MKHIFELRMKDQKELRRILAVTTQLKQLQKESLKKKKKKKIRPERDPNP